MQKDQHITESLRSSYWRKKIALAEPLTDYRPQKGHSENRTRFSERLSAGQITPVTQMAKGNEKAEYAIYLALFGLLISRYFNLRGSFIAGSLPGEGQAPEAVGSLFFQLKLERDQSVKTLISSTGKELMQSIANGGTTVPAENWVPFQFGFSFLPVSARLSSQSPVGLHLELSREKEGGLEVALECAPEAFQGVELSGLCRHFCKLVQGIRENLEKELADVPLLTSTDYDQVEEWAGSEHHPFQEKTIVELFETQVEQTPDNTALVFGGENLTYRILNARANRLAHYLREKKGIGRNSLVAVITDKSDDMLVSLLAIVKSGGAYMPLDPHLPESRLTRMLKDANPALVITELEYMQDMVPMGFPLLVLDLQLEGLPEHGDNLPFINQPEDLAYVMFTSGSTGTPNGVQVEQQSVVRLVKEVNYLQIQPSDRILQTGAISFDASTFEIWGAWLNGAALYLSKDRELLDIEVFRARIQDQKINILWMTAGWFHSVVDTDTEAFTGIQHLLTGGQRVSATHYEKLANAHPDLSFYVAYGPTENTTFSTVFHAPEPVKDELPIGTPITGTMVFLLNENLRLVPPGLKGEICLGGAGLARGYLNRPDLDAEKFVQSPELPGIRLYRTGDLGRWNRKGQLEFHGRRDRQLKIRGFRVEPGEVETQLGTHPAVRNCAVIGKEGEKGEHNLVGFFVADRKVEPGQLLKYLSERLPNYMIPATLLPVEELPLNANGKTDTRALLTLYEELQRRPTHTEPRNPLEQQLAEMWKEILGVTSVGIHDNFFTLGGHSLKVGRLISVIQKEMGYKVPINLVFEYPTIDQISTFIQDQQAKGASQIEVPFFRFNEGAGPFLFCFPAGNGFGLGYSDLAKALPELDVVAFNFMEAEDRAATYAEEMLRLQPDGPFILAGYSSGGNLALDIAQALEERGMTVEKVIIIDSGLRSSAESVSKEEAAAWATGFLNYHDFKTQFRSEYLQALIHDKVSAYYRYLKGGVDDGVLEADLHIIASASPTHNPELWSSKTKGRFFLHPGTGEHEEMLKGTPLKTNAQLIRQAVFHPTGATMVDNLASK